MSYLTGKCDLYDHVYSIGCKGTTDATSKVEKFNIFKKRTNGTIYQDIKLDVTKANIDYLVANDGALEKSATGYVYYGKEFKTLKSLNKFGYIYRMPIHFDTMLDLVPYLSYVPSVIASDENTELVIIPRLSYPEQRYREQMTYGNFDDTNLRHFKNKMFEEYNKTLEEAKAK